MQRMAVSLTSQETEIGMKTRFTQLVCVAFLAGFLGSQFADNSVQTQADEKKVEKKVDTKKTTRKKPRGRLPNYFSQVVDRKQREEIYAIQGKYTEEIAGLTKQLGDLKTKMTDECREVLTDEQKEKVDAIAAEAKKKAEDRRKTKSTKTTKTAK
jgi:hypothetical protein